MENKNVGFVGIGVGGSSVMRQLMLNMSDIDTIIMSSNLDELKESMTMDLEHLREYAKKTLAGTPVINNYLKELAKSFESNFLKSNVNIYNESVGSYSKFLRRCENRQKLYDKRRKRGVR